MRTVLRTEGPREMVSYGGDIRVEERHGVYTLSSDWLYARDQYAPLGDYSLDYKERES